MMGSSVSLNWSGGKGRDLFLKSGPGSCGTRKGRDSNKTLALCPVVFGLWTLPVVLQAVVRPGLFFVGPVVRLADVPPLSEPARGPSHTAWSA